MTSFPKTAKADKNQFEITQPEKQCKYLHVEPKKKWEAIVELKLSTFWVLG